MVHRPADSRLLSNLLSHEKDYAKALVSFLDTADSSLGSFSAYAAASSPPSSHAIIAVAASFAGANDALRKYSESVDVWRDQLKRLQELEDEVGNIMRDREILVTRLIKASKNQKSNRDSLMSPRASVLVSDSASSIGSNGPSKLSNAQTELQACEAHLAFKERELDYLRVGTMVGGLKSRCQALVDCGWAWGEIGKDALRALEEFELPNGTSPQKSNLPYLKFSPDHESSDVSSSLSPSQSASQIAFPVTSQPQAAPVPPPREVTGPDVNGAYLLTIPAAHAMPDQLFPRTIQRRITEENIVDVINAMKPSNVPPPDEGGSSDSEDDRPVEVVENKPFGDKSPKPLPKLSLRATSPPRTAARTTRSDVGPRYNEDSPPYKRERKRSNLFGALAGFFRHKSSASNGSAPPSPVRTSPAKSGWSTRTDRHLRKTARGDDSSDDERITGRASDAVIDYGSVRRKSTQEAKDLPTRPSLAAASSNPDGTAKRPKKSTLKKGKAASEAATSQMPAQAAENGWLSDGVITAARSRSPKPAAKATPAVGATTADGNLSRSSTVKSTKDPIAKAVLTDGVPKRRNSKNKGHSLSVQNAETIIPVGHESLTRSTSVRSTGSTGPRQRVASLDSAANRPGGPVTSDTMSETGRGKHSSPRTSHNRSMSVDFSRGEPNLMSIVEGVTRKNRAAWGKENPNNLLFEVKAPRGITALDIATPPEGQRRSSPTGSPVLPPLPSADPRRLSLTASASSPSLPLNAKTVAGAIVAPTPKLAGHTPGHVIVPLKSALRNRTPSPIPPMTTSNSAATNRPFSRVLTPPRVDSPEPMSVAQSRQVIAVAAPVAQPVIVPTLLVPEKGDDDTVSLASSYETGHEAFEDAEDAFPPTPTTHDVSDPMELVSASSPYVPVVNGNANSSKPAEDTELSFSSDTTSTPTSAPRRKKSVRMSLQPMFSPTPPAVEEDENDVAPWGPSADTRSRSDGDASGWHIRAHDKTINWEDSSDEDEEYKKARRLLNKAAKKFASIR